jgi:hypothetical protein
MFVLALALGMVAMLVAYQVIGRYRPDEASEAALVAGVPFVAVAVGAVVKARKHRIHSDADILSRDVKDLVWLLGGAGLYLFFLLFTWGL